MHKTLPMQFCALFPEIKSPVIVTVHYLTEMNILILHTIICKEDCSKTNELTADRQSY